MHESLFLKIRNFLTAYVTFPDPTYADICTLWAMGTHVYKRFDSFGYLVITASTKRAGKSVLAELLSLVSHDAKMGTSMTASVMRRLVSKGSTLFFDEAESLNSESASTVREFLNVGYRAGQVIYVSVGIEDVIPFPAYSPKAFILIGDVNDTLRDRSITIELRRASSERVYRRSECEQIAANLQGDIDIDNGDSALTHAIDSAWNGDLFDAYNIEILQGREAEIWTAILSLAHAFCPDRLDAIIACAVNLASEKMTVEKKRFSEIRRDAEATITDDTFTRYAIRDLASVLHANERAIFTEIAIERMKAIPTSPWRTYRGETGLTPMMLSDLVSSFGVKTRSVKIKRTTKRGFQRADILTGIKRMGGKS